MDSTESSQPIPYSTAFDLDSDAIITGYSYSDRVYVFANLTEATVTLGSLTHTYDGTAKTATATTDPAGLSVDLTYDGSSTAPVNAGSYAVVGTIVDDNYEGSASGTLVINSEDFPWCLFLPAMTHKRGLSDPDEGQ